MRPSISVTLEPGLERGVPWGRDLYTFVNSAAGHMMRTLQKPRKNRPSKRQVNHRRFLHNMIQRKFADIEAANHRLASSLYYGDEVQTSSGSDSAGPSADTTSGVRLPDNPPVNQHCSDTLKETAHIKNHHGDDSDQVDAGAKRQAEVGHLWRRQPKSQKRAKENQKSASSLECWHVDEGISLLEDQTLHVFEDLPGQNTVAAPISSPLSFPSCEFAIQMYQDGSSNSTESSWSDILDLFSFDGQEVEPDMDAYFESITGYASDDAFTDQFAHITQGLSSSRPEVAYEHSVQNQLWSGCEEGCNGDEGWNSEDSVEGQRWTDHQLHASFPSTDGHERHSCMMQESGNIQNLTPFEGVAQSYPASSQAHESRPLSRLPGEDDWLSTDILTTCIC